MTNYRFIDNMVASNRANQISLSLAGKTLFPYLTTVTDNNDPLGYRRIKCKTRANPAVETDYLLAAQPTYVDAPLPRINDTVLVMSVEGNDAQGVYMPIINMRRSPDGSQENPVDDFTQYIPGTSKLAIGENAFETVHNLKESRARNHLFTADLSYLVRSTIISLLSPYGEITIDADGITFSPGTAGRLRVNCRNRPFEIINATSVTINGKEIATVDAVDNDGDIIVDKGW